MRLKHTIILALIVLLIIAGCKKTETEEKRTPQIKEEKPANAQGLIMITLIEADVPEIELNVNKVFATTEKETTELSVGKKKVPLSKIRKEELLASGNVKQGEVLQIAIELEQNNTEYIMPGGLIKLDANFSVVKDKITIVRMKLLPEESFYETIEGRKIFAPTWKTEIIENGELTTFADRSVKLTRGSEANQTIKIGMNENGKTGVGVGIFNETKLTLLPNGKLANANLLQIQQNQMVPTGTVQLVVQNSALNPNKITLKAGETTRFRLKSLDEMYGIKIIELVIIASPEKEEEFEIKLDKKGVYDITCEEPCLGREGRILGRIVVI